MATEPTDWGAQPGRVYALVTGRKIHELHAAALQLLAEHKSDTPCRCRTCTLLGPCFLEGEEVDLVEAPVIAGLEAWNKMRSLHGPTAPAVTVVEGQLPTGVDLRSDGLITNAVEIVRKLRDAQRLLDMHEAELRRLSGYTRFTAGMKDDRRRHSEAAQIQRDLIRNTLR